MKRAAAVAVLVAALGALPAAPAGAATVELSMSNFRYCAAPACSPTDVGYPRGEDGPSGPDNPLAVVEVPRGSVVAWIYRDGLCDGFGCPGHNVVFENGSPQGARKGFVASNEGEKAIRAKITAKPGTTIRYFCSVNNHYESGMTGLIQVVP